MTLARQMYPDNTQYLMRKFKEATEKPFGYLYIDLKPTTPEPMRMRTEIFSDMPIKEHKPGATNQLQIPFEEERTHLNSSVEVKRPTFAIMDSSVGSALSSCDDCGLVFDSPHDLQRHIKRWCPENENRKRQLSLDDHEEPPKKKHHIFQSDEYEMDNEDDSPTESTEEDYFKRMKRRAKVTNEDTWSEKVKKYRKEGLSKREAEKKANKKMEETDFISFLNLYGKTILDMLDLKGGQIHEKVMNNVEKFLKKGYENLPAVRMALRKYKHLLEEMMYLSDDEETNDNEKDSEDEDENDDVDSEGESGNESGE